MAGRKGEEEEIIRCRCAENLTINTLLPETLVAEG
jgi:hypothetical protein